MGSNGTRLILPESCLNPSGQVLNIEQQKSNMQWKSHSSSHNPPTANNNNQYVKNYHNKMNKSQKGNQYNADDKDWINNARNNYKQQNNVSQSFNTHSNRPYNQNVGNWNQKQNDKGHRTKTDNIKKNKNGKRKSCIVM